MSDFFSFLRSNRSKIGLVDTYDLGEIYDADQRDALKNIFLDPDGLDQIYRLSRNGIIKEDIRTMGGLDLPVIHSLAIAEDTLSGVSFDISRHIRTNDDIGEPGKHSFSSKTYSDNVIVFHGGIAANNIEYNFLDENGELRTTTVPTSRESLFNSIKDTEGRVTLASYPSLFRIRRRSHLSELRLKDKLLTPRQTITESPTDVLNLPVYMRTSTNVDPNVTLLQCYSTKNSPIVFPVRISTSATFTIERSPADAASGTPFVFGYELKRARDGELIRSEVINSAESPKVSRTINVVGTLGQNQDCKLYIYLDPQQVETLELPGFGIKEELGRDIGLVGFSNLKKLNISNNSLSTYPVWLKTLDQKLEYLDIRNNSFWNNGIVEVFDYQDLRSSGISGRSDVAPPTITGVQVLGYSGFKADGTKHQTYTGEYNTITDSNSVLYKDLRKNAIQGNTITDTSEAEGFRTFGAMKELLIGPTAVLINADLSKLFPNLENLNLKTGGNNPRTLYGLLPKFNNSGQLITIDYHKQHSVGGTINYMGNTLTWTDAIQADYVNDPENAIAKQFIGQFKVKQFDAWHTDIKGGFLTGPDDVNSVNGRYHVDTQANVPDAWKGWIDNLQSANIGWYSNVCFKVATGSSLQWKKMNFLNINHAWANSPAPRVYYNSNVTTSESATDILYGNSWSRIYAWKSGWGGKVFSIANAPNISIMHLGGNDWSGYGNRADGFRYLLPDNFTDSSSEYQLSELKLDYLRYGQDRKLIFRNNDLKNLQYISELDLAHSKIFGKFPTIYNDGPLANRTISKIDVENCNFRDLSALGSSNTKRVSEIFFFSQGSSVGGALMPIFSASSNTVLSVVHGDGSLSSSYPSNWKNDTSLAGRPIASLFNGTTEENTVPGVTWYFDSSEEGEGERIYANNSGNVVLSSYLMVGDEIIYSNDVKGIVTQIDINNGYIYAKGSGIADIPSSGSNALTFRRRGQDISSYFENHSSMSELRLNNTRLVGEIPIFKGCKNAVYVDLGNNLLTDYKKGTIGTGSLLGTRGTVRLKKLWINNNPLSKESIRKIIKDCYDFVTTAGNRSYNISIYINNTKYDPTTKQYRNWTREEIFDGATTVTVPDPTEDNPDQTKTTIIPDPYESYFNRMGSGNTYPRMKISLF